MDLDFVHNYGSLVKSHWWWKSREEYVFSHLHEQIKNRETLNILEVGCGPGFMLPRLREFGPVTGLEPSKEMLNNIHLKDIEIINHDFLGHDFGRKKYDLILILDVIEHVKEDHDFVAKAHNLLNQKGLLLITVPAFHCIWTSHDHLNDHFRRYDKKSLSALLDGTDLRIVKLEYFFMWVALVKLGVRMIERTRYLLTKSEAKANQPTIGFFNGLIYLFCSWEFRIFRKIPKPFGSSLLLIAKK